MSCFSNKRFLIGLLVTVVAVVGLAYAFQWQTVLKAVPFLIVLACPLMHLFMMGGHNQHDRNGQADKKGKRTYSCH
ncbi:MAG: DUF2933 domain-containing protein [Patescibacteria group bacterium]